MSLPKGRGSEMVVGYSGYSGYSGGHEKEVRQITNGFEIHFKPEWAEVLGLGEAIILQYMVACMKAASDKPECIDENGRIWWWNTRKHFAKQYPFWTERVIRRLLKSLVDQGVLDVKRRSRNLWDQTRAYALTSGYEFLLELFTVNDTK